MSDRHPRGSQPVAPRHRHDRSAPPSDPPRDSSWPPVLLRLPEVGHELPPLPRASDAPQPALEVAEVPHTTADPAEPSAVQRTATVERAKRDKRWRDEATATGRSVISRFADPERDWRGPAYKLGGTLVAVALVVIILLALNRHNGDSSSPVSSVSDPDSVASAARSSEIVTADEPSVDVAGSDSKTGLTADADKAWLAGDPSALEESLSGDAVPPANPSASELAANDARGADAAEPAMPAHEQPTENDQPNSALAGQDREVNPAPSQSVTADPAFGTPRPTEQISRWTPNAAAQDAAANRPTRSSRLAPSYVQTPTQGYQQTAYPTTRRAAPSTRFEGRPRGQMAATQSYPSTPYTELYSNERGNATGPPRGATPVRTAERGAAGYGRPSPSRADTNRASARLQGRIEPFETGSHEHYR